MLNADLVQITVAVVAYGGFGLSPGCLIEGAGLEGVHEIVRREGRDLWLRKLEDAER